MDYKIILQNLRFTSISAENFANENQKNKFENLKVLFKDASAEYYGQKFETAFIKFSSKLMM